MPIYEYRCKSCDTVFEELVSASAKAPPCPSCGTKNPTRLYSTFATEWIPSNVSWHNMPSKHDMGPPAADIGHSVSFPKSVGDGKKSGGKKKAKGS
jgi:putative FmdB family regulatory protein